MAQVLPTLTRQQLGTVFTDPRTLLAFEAYLRQIVSVIPNDITALQGVSYVVTTVDPAVTPNAHAVAAGANINAAVTPGLITLSVTPAGSSGQIQFNNAGTLGAFTLSGDATVNVSTGVLTLANSGVAVGTYGDGTHVPQITFDAKGRATGVSLIAIASGTVTSVGLAMPGQFSVSNSPVTSSGTLTVAWANQSANTVLAGPSSGASSAPSFRKLVAADLPSGFGSSWLTLVTGAEPPVLVSDGAGRLITVAYAP